MPFKGINDQRDQELLRILPFVSTKREAPWLDNGHQMSYGDKSNYEGGRGDRIVQSVTVRVIYDQPPLNGWMILFPFLFSVFTTQVCRLVSALHSDIWQLTYTALFVMESLVNTAPMVRYDSDFDRSKGHGFGDSDYPEYHWKSKVVRGDVRFRSGYSTINNLLKVDSIQPAQFRIGIDCNSHMSASFSSVMQLQESISPSWR